MGRTWRNMESAWCVLALAQVLAAWAGAIVQHPSQHLVHQSNQQLRPWVPYLPNQRPSQLESHVLHQRPSQQLSHLSTDQLSQQLFDLSNQQPSIQLLNQSNQQPSQQFLHQSTHQPSQQLSHQPTQQPSQQSVHPPNQQSSPPSRPTPHPDPPASLSGPLRRPGASRGNSRRQRGLIDLRLIPCGGQCMTRASGTCRTDYACLVRRSLPWPTERK